VLQTIKDWNITQEIVPKIELVLEEVLTNIINYAYPMEKGMWK